MQYFVCWMKCMNDRKKIRGTKKLMIGFAQEEIKCEIKEGEAKKWKENGK